MICAQNYEHLFISWINLIYRLSPGLNQTIPEFIIQISHLTFCAGTYFTMFLLTMVLESQTLRPAYWTDTDRPMEH